MMRRREDSRRLLAIFALAVLLPALALAVLSYQSVAAERRALTAEREGGLHRAAWLLRRELVLSLAELRDMEEDRPYFQYNRWFFDPTAQGAGINYNLSPIAGEPANPLIAAYFTIDPTLGLGSPQSDLSQTAEAAARVPAQQREGRQQSAAGFAHDRAQEAIGLLEQSFVQNFDKNKALQPGQPKGKFPGVAQQSKKQAVTRKGAWANTQTREKIQKLNEGQQVLMTGSQEFQSEVLEVVLSPFLFERDPKAGLLAYRYVDVPNEARAFDGRPLLRYVQGFRIDEDYLGSVFRAFSRVYLDDLPGARSALLRDGEEAPDGRVVFRDSVDILPGYRVVVTDADPGWVDRRVARLSAVLIAVAGGLLLVISGGVFFALRTVRTEVGFARRKSDFVASVTHELRTPLTGIKMYADLLKEGWVRDEATRGEYVDFLAGEADRLTRLVNRVLDFARSEKGERRPVDPVDLAEAITEVVRSFGPVVERQGFALSVEVGEVRRSLADPDAVKQILLNLLENAVKYAGRADRREITLSVAEEGSWTVLAVADHGPGVPREEHDRIFMDFYRRGEELTRETTGTGIGLALVRRLAESMGGRVEYRDTEGGGATFRVLLRAAE